MNAAELLKQCNAAHVSLTVRGDALVVRGNTAEVEKFTADLKAHKAELIALIAANDDAADSSELDERAAFLEFCGGLSRTEAEQTARAAMVPIGTKPEPPPTDHPPADLSKTTCQTSGLITCGECQHFKLKTDHPQLGRCAQGNMRGYAGCWATDHHECEQFEQGAAHG